MLLAEEQAQRALVLTPFKQELTAYIHDDELLVTSFSSLNLTINVYQDNKKDKRSQQEKAANLGIFRFW